MMNDSWKGPLEFIEPECRCVPMDGSAWAMPHTEVWMNSNAVLIPTATFRVFYRKDQPVLSMLGMYHRRPVGEDYEKMMLRYTNGELKRDEVISMMKELQETNLLTIIVLHDRYFKVDRSN